MSNNPRRLIGRVKSWHDDRGFGFIEPQGGGADVFVHIKAFPRDAGRPQANQVLSFETEQDNRGRLRATRVWLPEPARAAASRRTATPPGSRRAAASAGPMARYFGRLAIPLAVVVIVAIYVAATDRPGRAGPIQDRSAEVTETNQLAGLGSSSADDDRTTSASDFRCDGRSYCSQMTSCKEARYFLRNCPRVEMDGDGDGVPCEGQWCGH